MSDTREILAIFGGLGGLAVLGYLSITGNKMALGAVVGIVSSVFSFYFAAKTSEHGQEQGRGSK